MTLCLNGNILDNLSSVDLRRSRACVYRVKIDEANIFDNTCKVIFQESLPDGYDNSGPYDATVKFDHGTAHVGFEENGVLQLDYEAVFLALVHNDQAEERIVVFARDYHESKVPSGVTQTFLSVKPGRTTDTHPSAGYGEPFYSERDLNDGEKRLYGDYEIGCDLVDPIHIPHYETAIARGTYSPLSGAKPFYFFFISNDIIPVPQYMLPNNYLGYTGSASHGFGISEIIPEEHLGVGIQISIFASYGEYVSEFPSGVPIMVASMVNPCDIGSYRKANGQNHDVQDVIRLWDNSSYNLSGPTDLGVYRVGDSVTMYDHSGGSYRRVYTFTIPDDYSSITINEEKTAIDPDEISIGGSYTSSGNPWDRTGNNISSRFVTSGDTITLMKYDDKYLVAKWVIEGNEQHSWGNIYCKKVGASWPHTIRMYENREVLLNWSVSYIYDGNILGSNSHTIDIASETTGGTPCAKLCSEQNMDCGSGTIVGYGGATETATIFQLLDSLISDEIFFYLSCTATREISGGSVPSINFTLNLILNVFGNEEILESRVFQTDPVSVGGVPWMGSSIISTASVSHHELCYEGTYGDTTDGVPHHIGKSILFVEDFENHQINPTPGYDYAATGLYRELRRVLFEEYVTNQGHGALRFNKLCNRYEYSYFAPQKLISLDGKAAMFVVRSLYPGNGNIMRFVFENQVKDATELKNIAGFQNVDNFSF